MVQAQRADFWKFFVGQGLSVLGGSFTAFALPLLVYQMTGSAANLSISFASAMLPYLFFGLIGGAIADRTNRKRLMILTDLGRGAVIGSIPVLYYLDALPIWWIYVTGFISTVMRILFDAAEFAAIPSLVSGDNLVQANGRIHAVYSAAFIAGPPLAGLTASVMPIVNVLWLDALSFILSALFLAWIRSSFNQGEQRERRGIRSEIAEGLGYVWRHPVLRNISIMMALVNFVTTVQQVQLVLFAKERLDASDFQYGLLLAGSNVGVIILSLAAGPLRKRFPFGPVALGALAVWQLLVIAFALAPSYWVALPLWALASGCGVLFNINTASLR
ncbi:MAG: MFS transporter, partial [Chloroflexota bacterium]|nr:MFS transporter [Chloroflexota bacterium]